jgi:hypothetical protein
VEAVRVAWHNYHEAMTDLGYEMLPPWPALDIAIAALGEEEG